MLATDYFSTAPRADSELFKLRALMVTARGTRPRHRMITIYIGAFALADT